MPPIDQAQSKPHWTQNPYLQHAFFDLQCLAYSGLFLFDDAPFSKNKTPGFALLVAVAIDIPSFLAIHRASARWERVFRICSSIVAFLALVLAILG